MRRRVSASVTLVLIGSAALSGCGDNSNASARDLYRSRADCQRDWGDDPKKCEAITSGAHGGYWYGPAYSTGHSTSTSSAPRTGSHAVGTHVSRGGFGSSASAHGAGS